VCCPRERRVGKSIFIDQWAGTQPSLLYLQCGPLSLFQVVERGVEALFFTRDFTPCTILDATPLLAMGFPSKNSRNRDTIHCVKWSGRISGAVGDGARGRQLFSGHRCGRHNLHRVVGSRPVCPGRIVRKSGTPRTSPTKLRVEDRRNIKIKILDKQITHIFRKATKTSLSYFLFLFLDRFFLFVRSSSTRVIATLPFSSFARAPWAWSARAAPGQRRSGCI